MAAQPADADDLLGHVPLEPEKGGADALLDVGPAAVGAADLAPAVDAVVAGDPYQDALGSTAAGHGHAIRLDPMDAGHCTVLA